MCPAHDHFMSLTLLIMSLAFVLCLTQMLVFLSLYVMLSMLLSILVCACLVGVPHMSYIIGVHMSLRADGKVAVEEIAGVAYNHQLCLCDVHIQTHLPTFLG